MSKINPNGVVPSLVYNGDIIIESTVIMEFLDEIFPENSLKPSNPKFVARMRLWNKKLDEGIHSALSVISSSIAFRYQILENKTLDEVNRSINLIPDIQRRELMKETIFNGVNSELFPKAIKTFDDLFYEMDQYLESNEWLASEKYSLSDAAFTPYLTRFEHLNLSLLFKNRVNLTNWFIKIKKRQSFDVAITNRLNKDYLKLMSEKGFDANLKVRQILGI